MMILPGFNHSIWRDHAAVVFVARTNKALENLVGGMTETEVTPLGGKFIYRACSDVDLDLQSPMSNNVAVQTCCRLRVKNESLTAPSRFEGPLLDPYKPTPRGYPEEFDTLRSGRSADTRVLSWALVGVTNSSKGLLPQSCQDLESRADATTCIPLKRPREQSSRHWTTKRGSPSNKRRRLGPADRPCRFPELSKKEGCQASPLIEMKSGFWCGRGGRLLGAFFARGVTCAWIAMPDTRKQTTTRTRSNKGYPGPC
ncbi:uncharacterized protein BDV17DRAFT_64549 [Aspergillus undulatus]|uniref:uncharacterized protein n=1 Tax=Aspergillus undulatus TaxID=1810928 RepID=UPI003CCCCEA4